MNAGERWTRRLERLSGRLEDEFKPTVVLLESRSGLHDIAATTVTDLDAEVLLFATDSQSHWTDCDILFRHWQDHGLGEKIGERLSLVSALTPELDTEQYLLRFGERAWNLFRDRLYDEPDPFSESDEAFSFALHDDDAPHDPFVIHWTRDLAAGVSLRDFEETTVHHAYAKFLGRFDGLMTVDHRGEG